MKNIGPMWAYGSEIMKKLFEKELILTPSNEKTNILLPFRVEEEYEKLIITYSYSPKELSDCERAENLIEENLRKDTHGDRELYPDYRKYLPLKNLVTLSLDSPSKYMGAAHRQDREQCHIISETFSSVGFLKGKIEKGLWILYLNVHALVTESCTCKVKIEAGGDGDE